MHGFCYEFQAQLFVNLSSFSSLWGEPVFVDFIFQTLLVYGIAKSEIFIEPPPDAQQRRRRGERGTGVTKGS
jgi:hypothetical protein